MAIENSFAVSVLLPTQETDGGALYVERGSSATFLGEAYFLQNTVISAALPSTSSATSSDDADYIISSDDTDYIIRSGGAIFNGVRCGI